MTDPGLYGAEPMRRDRTSQLRGFLRSAYWVVHHHDDHVHNLAWLAQSLAQAEQQLPRAPRPDDPLSSRMACQADCGAEYLRWMTEFGRPPNLERKSWEYAAISRALDAAGCLAPGRRGLGFAVGKEPLAAAYAAHGCEIVATDLAMTDRRAAEWKGIRQDAREPSPHSGVSRREADMTAIPVDLTGFDFCWSSCAFEHLGSVEAGLAFVEASVRCLRPGGWAVHTTEYNLDSDTDGATRTVQRGPTVLYRRRDIEELARRLGSAGHRLAPLAPWRLTGILDGFIDLMPYHYSTLILRLAGYRVTSAVLVIQAAD